MIDSSKIKDIKKMRFEFLRYTYEYINGSTSKFVSSKEIASQLGFELEETIKIVEYLDSEGLIKIIAHHGLDVAYNILHQGIVEIETALSEPEKSTEHFPPINIMHVGKIFNSQIQQGSVNSNISVVLEQKNINELKNLIQKLESELKNFGLDVNTIEEAKAELSTVSSQLNSPKPKVAIIREGLKSIRTILEGVTGNIIASEALKVILFQLQNLG